MLDHQPPRVEDGWQIVRWACRLRTANVGKVPAAPVVAADPLPAPRRPRASSSPGRRPVTNDQRDREGKNAPPGPLSSQHQSQQSSASLSEDVAPAVDVHDLYSAHVLNDGVDDPVVAAASRVQANQLIT